MRNIAGIQVLEAGYIFSKQLGHGNDPVLSEQSRVEYGIVAVRSADVDDCIESVVLLDSGVIESEETIRVHKRHSASNGKIVDEGAVPALNCSAELRIKDSSNDSIVVLEGRVADNNEIIFVVT